MIQFILLLFLIILVALQFIFYKSHKSGGAEEEEIPEEIEVYDEDDAETVTMSHMNEHIKKMPLQDIQQHQNPHSDDDNEISLSDIQKYKKPFSDDDNEMQISDIQEHDQSLSDDGIEESKKLNEPASSNDNSQYSEKYDSDDEVEAPAGLGMGPGYMLAQSSEQLKDKELEDIQQQLKSSQNSSQIPVMKDKELFFEDDTPLGFTDMPQKQTFLSRSQQEFPTKKQFIHTNVPEFSWNKMLTETKEIHTNKQCQEFCDNLIESINVLNMVLLSGYQNLVTEDIIKLAATGYKLQAYPLLSGKYQSHNNEPGLLGVNL